MKLVQNLLFTLAFAFLLSASSTFTYAQTSSFYSQQAIQQPIAVLSGKILQVRTVVAEATQGVKTTGGVLGGALGALLGAQVAQNRSSNGFILASAMGALGATGGVALASNYAIQESQEMVIQLDDGRVISVAQSNADGMRFQPGQKIYFMNGRIAPFLR